MAKIVLCSACSGQVSSAALSCPHCGQPLKSAPTQYGCLSSIVVIGLGLFIVAMISNIASGPRAPPPLTAAPPPEPPNEIARDNAATDALNNAVLFMSVVKSTMRNPDSFKIESALQIEGTNDVCFQYMAQNGFGGMNQGFAVYDAKTMKLKIEAMSGFRALWNKDCKGKQGTEHTVS